MYKLTIELNPQLEETIIFFDKEEAEYRKRGMEEGGDGYECKLEEITFESFVEEARDAGCDDYEIWEWLTNMVDGHRDLERKASLYDKMIEDRRKGAKAINNISKEEMSARAKKAASARWNKDK